MTKLKLRVLFDRLTLGPGKAALLAGIRDTGSISAAGRQMQMSYKRAWMLVEEMNAAFSQPLVISARGGQGGGGAQLTDAGAEVLHLYQSLVAHAMAAAASQIARLEAMQVNDMSEGK